MVEETFKDTQIRLRTIIEVLGKPKEHVEKTIRDYIAKIKERDDIIILSENYSETKQQEMFFSVFVEIEMIVKSIEVLIGFCFDYMPSSVEIIKPEQFTIRNNILTSYLNDLQARLHKVDMIAKQLKNQNDYLSLNLNKALKNQITLLLKMEGRSYEELSRLTGINKKDLKAYLDQMIKNNDVKKEGDLYYTTK